MPVYIYQSRRNVEMTCDEGYELDEPVTSIEK